MTDYIDFFLKSASTVIRYETLEISHPDFTKTYYVVRNNTKGLTATLETSSEQFFEYVPMSIRENGISGDLDYGLTVDFGDVGELIPLEIDEIAKEDGMFVEPTVKYRSFRSDDLSAPMFGPITLKIKSFTFNKTGSTFEAVADKANTQRTGELYTVDRFPMLRAFL